MEPDGTAQVAVFVDFENLVLGAFKELPGEANPAPYDALTRLCRGYGNASVRRACADWADPRFGTHQDDLAMNGVDLIQVARVGIQNKNAADIRMAVDAMETLIVHPEISVFVPVSGDGDYSPLVQRPVPARLPAVPGQDPQGRSGEHDLPENRPGTPRGGRPGQLAMRRAAARPDRAPPRGPGAWFIRFAGLNGIICPLGFGAFTIPSILSVAGGSGIVYVWGTQYSDHVGGQPYGSAPFELTATRATVLLLMTGFIAACLVQLAGGILLILLRPPGFVVLPAGMLLSAVFWWGFDLPLAWLSTALDLPVLAAAWLVYRRASCKLPAAAPPPRPSWSGRGSRR